MNTLPIKPLNIEDVERFAKKFAINEKTGCWDWIASKRSSGYGQLWLNGTMCSAHRVSYAIHHNGLDTQLQIDHLCRNRACVNASHLELVTPSVNVTRGESPAQTSARLLNRFASMTHCKNGHEYTEENTRIYMRTSQNGKTYAKRICRPCNKIRLRRLFGVKE